MSKFYKYDKKFVAQKPQNKGTTVYFDGWAVTKEGDDFFVSYISSEHGGSEKKFKISEKDYYKAIEKNLGLLDLIGKYK